MKRLYIMCLLLVLWAGSIVLADQIQLGHTTNTYAAGQDLENYTVYGGLWVATVAGTVDSLTVWKNMSSNSHYDTKFALYRYEGGTIYFLDSCATFEGTTGANWDSRPTYIGATINVDDTIMIGAWSEVDATYSAIVYYTSSGVDNMDSMFVASRTFSLDWPSSADPSTSGNSWVPMYVTYTEATVGATMVRLGTTTIVRGTLKIGD